MLRYVERNPLRAGLAEQAEEWPWSSLWTRSNQATVNLSLLSDWPISLQVDWTQYVNQAETEAELIALRNNCNRGTHYGSPEWIEQTTLGLGLESTARKPGRPRKRLWQIGCIPQQLEEASNLKLDLPPFSRLPFKFLLPFFAFRKQTKKATSLRRPRRSKNSKRIK